MNTRNGFLRAPLLGLALASACADAPQDPSTVTLGGDGARIHRSETGRLTGPSGAAANDVVRGYLQGFVKAAADQLTFASQTTSRDGISHLRFQQSVDGLRVYNAYVKAAITDRGELVQVIEKVAPATGAPPAINMTHQDALGIATKEYGYVCPPLEPVTADGNTLAFDQGTSFDREPTVERVAYLDNGQLQQGYLIETWAAANNQLDHTLVSGTGAIVSTERRTANDSYNVFAQHPANTSQTVIQGPGAGNDASPSGWLAGDQLTFNISGNNARAYLDARNNNRPDRGGTAVSDGNFLAVADLSAAPTTTTNREVAIQNLFYLNNVSHDVLYRHGFTEAAGNFQADNFANGGAGGDPVKAEAQDGSGTDNANFSTPADGSSPRMQMYLWSGAGPNVQVLVGTSEFGGQQSSFGPLFTATAATGALAIVNDGVGTVSDGCEASASGALTGKIAVVDRGTCDFTIKVRNAQAAGAIAVLIANNVGADEAFGAGGTDRKVKIPSAMVGNNAGTSLKALAGETATARKHPTEVLQIDASLDSDVVYHEYGHGLTWRMIGGMGGPLAGAIGEGMSDVVAMLINGDDVVGEYSASNPLGIRRYRYAGYPLTYKDVAGAEVHDDGELYAAIGWRLIELFDAAEISRDVLFGYLIDGMNYTPATPAWEHMRDGILQAVSSPADRCLIWQAFAQFGVGVGASGQATGSGVVIVESFDQPAECP